MRKHDPKPEDIKQWWQASCCGPRSTDASEQCGFCGEPVLECASKHSDYVAAHPELNHDGCILGDGQDDPEKSMTCGGSGFWCSGCGRFWAQDTCGNNSGIDHVACDGVKMILDECTHRIYCVCGKWLMTDRIMEPSNG